jgi:hypothetical protein
MAVPSITQHRHAEVPRQVGAGRRAVEQAHHAFDQDQVGLARRFPQRATFLLADHPHVQLIHRRAAGALEDHRVEKSGPHLNTRTLRPRLRCKRASAAVTVVLPWPDAGAAINTAGQ